MPLPIRRSSTCSSLMRSTPFSSTVETGRWILQERLLEIQRRNRPIKVVGIPKTIDNDIAVTDHAPGLEAPPVISLLPFRACGGCGGSADSCFRDRSDGPEYGVADRRRTHRKARRRLRYHLLFAPEVAFDEGRFLDEVSSLYKKHRHVVVVASEGCAMPMAIRSSSRSSTDRSVYYGDVSAHLAMLVIKRGIKARSEKPGILGRSSIAYQSSVDRDEAILVGKKAVQAALEGDSEVMVGFKRISDEPIWLNLFSSPLKR